MGAEMGSRSRKAFAKDWQDRLIREVSEGKSLREVCRAEDMPSRPFVYEQLEEQKDFANRYARATEDRADKIFEEILDIADNAEGDIAELEDGREIVNHENIQRSKLRVDARKWMLGKMQPTKYGDRMQVDQKQTIVNIGNEDADL